MLDQATQAQFAHSGALRRLLVCEATEGVPQEMPVLGQRGQQVRTLTRRAFPRCGHAAPPSVVSAGRTLRPGPDNFGLRRRGACRRGGRPLAIRTQGGDQMSESFAALDNEFAGIGESAAKARLGDDAVPGVHRGWVTVPGDEHIGAVVWGSGPPEVVFVHEAGRSARAWDEVALRLGRPSVAIDLPGHGRSDWRPDGRYEPRKLAGTLAEAIRSLAPRVSLVVGGGLGGRTSLALITTPRPTFLPRVALIDTLPGWPHRE